MPGTSELAEHPTVPSQSSEAHHNLPSAGHRLRRHHHAMLFTGDKLPPEVQALVVARIRSDPSPSPTSPSQPGSASFAIEASAFGISTPHLPSPAPGVAESSRHSVSTSLQASPVFSAQPALVAAVNRRQWQSAAAPSYAGSSAARRPTHIRHRRGRYTPAPCHPRRRSSRHARCAADCPTAASRLPRSRNVCARKGPHPSARLNQRGNNRNPDHAAPHPVRCHRSRFIQLSRPGRQSSTFRARPITTKLVPHRPRKYDPSYKTLRHHRSPFPTSQPPSSHFHPSTPSPKPQTADSSETLSISSLRHLHQSPSTEIALESCAEPVRILFCVHVTSASTAPHRVLRMLRRPHALNHNVVTE